LFGLSSVDGFAFDVEILVLAQLMRLSVREVPVRWRHQPGSRVSPLRDSLTMASDVVRIRRGGWSKVIPAVEVQPVLERVRTESATCVLARNVRSTDTVFGIGRGAMVPLPFASAANVLSVVDRLQGRLHDFAISPTEVKVDDVIDLAPTQRHAYDRVVTAMPLEALADRVLWSGAHA
jgi:hypothetical protein